MEKKKFKFSVIDVIISLAIIALIVAGVKIINKTEVRSNGIPDVEFTVEIKQKTQSYADSIKKGGDVYDSVKGGYFGTVTNVEAKPAEAVAADTVDGKYVMSHFEDRYDVYVTIHGTPSTFTDKDVKFASKEVKIGEEAFIKSKNYTGTGYIVKMDILDENGGAAK